MKITFIGATHEVTGSSFYLEAAGKKILIDCGMEQGIDTFENRDLPISAAALDAVFLTHAHMDHSGKIPLLYAQGFRGPVFATSATTELCNIMLKDSAHIQMFEAEWKNRKARRSGEDKYEPVYTMDDAIGALSLFESCHYNHRVHIFEGIDIRFIDAGHLLGSASIELWVTEEDITKKIVFSGDIGDMNQPLIEDPSYITTADYVIMESTYGDRNHEKKPDYVEELSKMMQETFDNGGNLVIPSFAVGRTQALLYFIRIIKEKKLIKGHGNFKVYLDSPMAIEATQIFNDNTNGYFDKESMNLIKKGINPIDFDGLIKTVTSDESKEINFDEEPKVIISASGMCEAGRIRHHLKHNLWRKESTILFVGYQAVGSLGSIIKNGAKTVKLFGEEIEVNARIKTLKGVSGHADRDGLIKWVKSFDQSLQHVFVVHGDHEVMQIFEKTLNEDLKIKATSPKNGAIFDLKLNEYIYEGELIEVKKKEEKAVSSKKKEYAAFDRLFEAGKRLLAVIERNKSGANKDLAKFTSQINSLSDKWDR